MNDHINDLESEEQPEDMRSNGNTAPALKLFGNFEILDEIGRGGMGIVYRALDRSLDRIVALKVLRDDLRSHPHLVTRFQREARAVACLDHPNIVQIYTVGSVENIPYFTMEYVDATPLSVMMRQRRRIEWEEALAIAQQVADALECAHEAQIIHRDIKPPNILVAADGHTFVTDFGIAKVLTAEEQLTVDGARLGTPQYMSPERCATGEVSASSDVYSLGVVLFQMLTGRLPHEARDHAGVIKEILSKPPARVRDYAPDCPEMVERLVAFLIEKKPEDRPSTAGVAREAIARVRAGGALDKNGNMLEATLAGFRDTFGPATPLTPSATAATPRERLAATTSRVRAVWRRVPGGARRLLFAAAVGAACIASMTISMGLVRWVSSPPLLPAESGHVARWGEPAHVAVFERETMGMVLARLRLEGFTPGTAAWATDGTGLLVQLDGAPGTPRAGQRALCLVSPHDWRARLLVPPLDPVDVAHPLVVLPGGNRSEISGPLVGFMTPHGWEIAGLGDGDAPFSTLAFSGRTGALLAADVHPEGVALLIAETTPGTRESVLREFALGPAAAAEGRTVGTVRGRVSRIEYLPDGARALVTAANGRQAGAVMLLDIRSGEARPLIEGELEAREGGLSPDGMAWAGIVHVEGTPTLRMAPLEDYTEAADLGPAAAAAWHPTARTLIAAAEDGAGVLQMWAVEAAEPHRREQLTFIDPGLAPACAVSPDGKWAMGFLRSPNGPTLVFVELTGAR